MKVYMQEADCQRLIGHADIEDAGLPAFEVQLFGPSSIIRETFTIGTVTHFQPIPPFDISVERAVILGLGQRPEILPGWLALAS